MSAPPLVCLVTPGHVSSTPRLVKEADALQGAGYRVHVVAGRNFPGADALDQAVLSAARWECTRVDSLGAGRLRRGLGRRLWRSLAANSRLRTPAIAARALNPMAGRLARAAAHLRADLYIGHCVPGLAAAAAAAARTGSAFGFDAEDFHDTENDAVLSDAAERGSVAAIQSGFLRGCVHLTASSPMISRAYAERYGVSPLTILNVFPRALAPAALAAGAPVSESRPAVAYWFSQTIGPGRGLEESVAALARMRTPVELHLRGFPAAGYAGRLQQLASGLGLKRPVVFLPPAAPDEMARLASAADIGLSTEGRHPPNRNLCLTNKVFTYLLAGIPQLMSDTDAQRALSADFGEAALLASLSDPAGTASALDRLMSDPAALAAARRRALSLAFNRYCWEVESIPFVESVGRAVRRKPAGGQGGDPPAAPKTGAASH
ncbi:MAG TPA: hypothetical protein VGG34_10855 [Opitutaceae bacterium]|jgi:glycosyltransferase involved in cell wall biosynthesis